MAELSWLTSGNPGYPCLDCTLAIRPGSKVWDIDKQTYIPREVCQSCDEARRQAALLASRSLTSPSARYSSLMALISRASESVVGPS